MYKSLQAMGTSGPAVAPISIWPGSQRYRFQGTCSYRSEGCLTSSGTENQHFSARDVCFPTGICSVYGKPLVAMLSPSFLHFNVFRQKPSRTGTPGAGADGRSPAAQTKAHRTGPEQTPSNSYPSYNVVTLRCFALDLSCTFKLLISEKLNMYSVIQDGS